MDDGEERDSEDQRLPSDRGGGEGGPAETPQQGTLSFLLRQIRNRSDPPSQAPRTFPLARHVSASTGYADSLYGWFSLVFSFYSMKRLHRVYMCHLAPVPHRNRFFPSLTLCMCVYVCMYVCLYVFVCVCVFV